MATPYQQLGYSQPPPTSANDESCCGPDCVGCCAKPGCCLEPAGCCSRVGACPCFCSKSATSFSLALVSLWTALPLLICSMSLPDLFTARVFDVNCTASLALFQVCSCSLGNNFGDSTDWSYQCASYEASNIDIGDVFGGQDKAFNALRLLVAASTGLTFVAAILSPIRLAVQQRSQPISASLNYALIAMLLLAFATAAAAFALSFPVFNALWTFGISSNAARGSAWATLTAAVGMLAVGLVLHLAAHHSYQSKLAQRLTEQPGMDVHAAYPAASSVSVPAPIFAHPQPQYFAAVAYPVAAVHNMPPAPTHSSMTPTPRAYVPAPLYAR